MNGNKEFILCAAVWVQDDEVHVHQPSNIHQGFVICGFRHGFIFNTLGILDPERTYLRKRPIQGFLTNKNRFLNRRAAAALAHKAGQTEVLMEELFSEDVY